MKQTWKDVPVPARMQALEKDKRGFPVPYVVLRDKHGVPQFQINDELRVRQALAQDLCAICGEKMNDDKWLVGGPQSAFHPQGAYIDTPTHHACLEYALKVCPYLAFSSYKKRMDFERALKLEMPDHAIATMDPTQDESRVPFFVAVKVSGYRILTPSPTRRYLKPHRPYLQVQFWNDGEQITDQEANLLILQNQLNPKKGVR
jgi:hypothetical protein